MEAFRMLKATVVFRSMVIPELPPKVTLSATMSPKTYVEDPELPCKLKLSV
jgi:hypothetical protein